MTEIWIWGLIASLILLAVGTSLKAASESIKVQRLDDEVSALRREIDTINQRNDVKTSDLAKLNAAEKEKLINRISELEHQFNLLPQPPQQPRRLYG